MGQTETVERNAREPESLTTTRLRQWVYQFHYLIPRSSRDYRIDPHWSKIKPTLLPEGDAIRGKSFLSREFRFYDESHVIKSEQDWHPEKASALWMMKAHSFDWIGDLRAYNDSPIASSQLREYIYQWIECAKTLPGMVRHPTIMGQRISQWLIYSDFILAGTSLRFQRRFIRSLAKQTLLLERELQRLQGRASFAAIQGLCFASAALPYAELFRERALASLVLAINTQVRPDGGHVTRSPSMQLEQLEYLINLRPLLASWKVPETELLHRAIQSMQQALSFLCHADGKLALFNDSVEERPDRIRTSVASVVSDMQGVSQCSSYVKLKADKTFVLCDTGVSNPQSAHSHFGTLSFEMSDGLNRMVVNCGAYRGPSQDWRKVCKSTSAHSALSIADENAYPIDAQAALSFLHEPRVEVKIPEHAGQFELLASYNGYESRFGLVHTRHLKLQKHGMKLEGFDEIKPIHTESEHIEHTAIIRFHLHPHVKITKIHEGEITLGLPSGSHWMFRANTEKSATIEESVYSGEEGKPQRSTQILIESNISSQITATIGWSFEKV
jgi:uncharacterized heparinase superfamily protein